MPVRSTATLAPALRPNSWPRAATRTWPVSARYVRLGAETSARITAEADPIQRRRLR
ncbi:hypothetical protein OHB01_26345 [Microbispora hainanensis]|uniref:Uncharacterized protein n=1 Tax=Microbispora hainanensis TaxID=568844 RepID=A0ABZ1SWU6_9ACTN|nr:MULTISPECIES: hypothetical protein [Microbispora]